MREDGGDRKRGSSGVNKRLLLAHPQSQRPTPRDIVISLDILNVIMKDEFSVSVQKCPVGEGATSRLRYMKR